MLSLGKCTMPSNLHGKGASMLLARKKCITIIECIPLKANVMQCFTCMPFVYCEIKCFHIKNEIGM